MATTSLIINTKDQEDKALTKTITNVNANCASSTLKTVAQMLNGLTTNTYVKTDRVDKSNVDTATDTPKQARNVNFYITKKQSASENYVQLIADDVTEVETVVPNNGMLQVWLGGDALDMLPSSSSTSSDGVQLNPYYVQYNFYDGETYDKAAMKWEVKQSGAGKSVTLTVNLPESMTYQAYSRTVTVNFVAS